MTRPTWRTALVLCAAAFLAVAFLGAGRITASPPVAPSPGSLTTTYGPGPLMVPKQYLVVPEPLVPNRGEDPRAIESSIRRAYGPLLDSVSVESTAATTDFPDAFDFWVSYRLRDCPVEISTFLDLSGLTDCSLVPPLTQLQDTPPGADWMSGSRLRILLRAYAKVADAPFGGLESFRTASGRNLDEPLSVTAATVNFAGEERRIADLWVVTPGARTLREFRKVHASNDGVVGYVFNFPADSQTPEYLGRVQGLGAFSTIF